MALLVPLRRVARACMSAVRPRAPSLTGGGACGGRDVPACAPCVPAPQPACRARPPTVRRAQRVVCCAPPQGARPPCAPRDPTCSLTCQDNLDQNRELSTRVFDEIPSESVINGCDCEQDPVAQRLKLAKRAQRAEYEREVARRVASKCVERAPPPAPYRLGRERECARATDGCLYAVPRAAAAPRASCGPGRTPPPPRCVELAPDDACRIKGDAHLDPCAHRPRVMIEIDRSANTMAKKAPPAVKAASPCARGGGAPRAGDASWCANPPPPAAAPPRCRRPTIIERLRARSAPRLPDSRNERRLHTSVAISKAVKSPSSVSGGIEGIIRSKEKLKETGRGRVALDSGASRAAPATPPGGRLELCVPPGTERVAVLVSLEGAASADSTGACSASTAASSAATSCAPAGADKSSFSCNNFSAISGKRDPWLSIKNIQKRLTGCRCEETSTGPKAGSPSVGTACPDKLSATSPPMTPPVDGSRLSASCGKPVGKASCCRPPTPARCGGSPNDSKRDTKRCSSTSALLANTIVVSS